MSLQIQNLAFVRNHRDLFREIHFDLHPGELIQISGANGCGKSTLLKMLAGFIEVEEGKILWHCAPIQEQRDHYQTALHYLGHQNGVNLHLTVEENLAYFAALKKIKLIQKEKTLEKIGLQKNAKKPAFHLSAGQKRRLALSRLLLNPAKLWILDEPTTALDVDGQQLFFDLLTHHLSEGGMAILTMHHTLPVIKNFQELRLGEKHA